MDELLVATLGVEHAQLARAREVEALGGAGDRMHRVIDELAVDEIHQAVRDPTLLHLEVQGHGQRSEQEQRRGAPEVLGGPTLVRRTLDDLAHQLLALQVGLGGLAAARGAGGTDGRDRSGRSPLLLDGGRDAGERLQPQRRRRKFIGQQRAVGDDAILHRAHLGLHARGRSDERALEARGVDFVEHAHRVGDGEFEEFVSGHVLRLGHRVVVSRSIRLAGSAWARVRARVRARTRARVPTSTRTHGRSAKPAHRRKAYASNTTPGTLPAASFVVGCPIRSAPFIGCKPRRGLQKRPI